MKKSKLLKENEERAIESLRKILSEKFGLVEMRLFGSKARGESTPESDMDVMIEIVESNPYVRFGIYDVIFEINLENDTFISASIFGKKEIEDGPMGESPLYKIIHKEGIPI